MKQLTHQLRRCCDSRRGTALSLTGWSLAGLSFVAITSVVVSVTNPSWVIADEPAGSAETKEGSTESDERFDLEVREDIFAGFSGDKERLARGLARCEAALAQDKEHAEAMVWRGAVRVFQSGNQFAAGNPGQGMMLWSTGLQDMETAKKLQPDSLAVMIPRAAVMIAAGRNAPAIMGQPLLLSVRDDYEQVLERQKEFLDQIGEHPLGELRMGLADIYRLLDQSEQSVEQLTALREELPGTEYAKRADQWLAAKPDAKLAHNCIGCHE